MGHAVVVPLAFAVIVDLLTIAALLQQARLLALAAAGDINLGLMTASDHRLQMLSVIALVLIPVTAVAVLRWMHRTYANLPSLGAQGLSLSPRQVVLAFFIPFVNLVRPYHAMSDIWRASEPRAGADGQDAWQSHRVPLRIRLWWACWLGRGVLSYVSFVAANTSNGASDNVDAFQGLRFSTWLLLSENAVSVVDAVLLMSIVVTISAWQEQRALQVGAQTGERPAARLRDQWQSALGILLLLAIAGGIVSVGQSRRVVWKEFSPPRGEFTVEMPGEPKHASHQDGSITVETYTTTDGAGIYLASSFDVGDEPIADPVALLDVIKNAKVEALHGTLGEEHDLTVGEQPAKEFVILNPQLAGARDARLRVFTVANRVFQFGVMGDEATRTSANATKFFSSIHVPGMWQRPPFRPRGPARPTSWIPGVPRALPPRRWEQTPS